MIRIKNKKGDGNLLPEYLVKIVIAGLCLVFLIGFIWLLYVMINADKDKDHAKASLALIVKTMVDAENNGISSATIISPRGWSIVSFPFFGQDKDRMDAPDNCQSGVRCICICSEPDECKKEKICSNVPNGKYALVSGAASASGIAISGISINQEIDKVLNIVVKSDKSNTLYYKFSINPETLNFNNLLNGGQIGDSFGASALEKLLTGPVSVENVKENNPDIAIAKSSNAKGIHDGARAYDINDLLVLSILQVKYGGFEKYPAIDNDNRDARQKLIAAVGDAGVKESVLAGSKGIQCDAASDDLIYLSKCIANVLKQGYDGYADGYFGGKIPGAEKDIDGVKIAPENKDSAALWFYSQNIQEVVKITQQYTQNKVLLTK